jgi:1,4-alpha-glucan branching enzyme
MGWMHDILQYLSCDPVSRKYHQNSLTFALLYAFTENFVLVLSHDEVVYGKRSLLDKMPGDRWQKFANLRLLFAYMYAQPGKKLMFMGGEFGQWWEWNSDTSLDWHLLQEKPHETLQTFVKDLNTVYQQEPALHELDFTQEGFQWIDFGDYEQSVVAFIRRAKERDDFLVFVFNFTTAPKRGYRIGVPKPGFYRELLNSDSEIYGGSNMGNLGGQETEALSWQGLPYSLRLDLPPLAGLVLKLTSE